MHHAGAVGNGNRVMVKGLTLSAEFLLDGGRIFGNRPFDDGDFDRLRPGCAVVAATPQEDVGGAPITLVRLPRLAVGEQSALRRDDRAGDTVQGVPASAGREQVAPLEQWSRGVRGSNRNESDRDEQ